MTLVQTCDNPNQYDLTTRMEGSEASLNLPNFSNPINYKPYLKIATSNQTQDITLHAKKTTAVSAVVFGSMAIEDLLNFATVAGQKGYAALYTNISGKGESCLTLFGYKHCVEATQKTWC